DQLAVLAVGVGAPDDEVAVALVVDLHQRGSVDLGRGELVVALAGVLLAERGLALVLLLVLLVVGGARGAGGVVAGLGRARGGVGGLRGAAARGLLALVVTGEHEVAEPAEREDDDDDAGDD